MVTDLAIEVADRAALKNDIFDITRTMALARPMMRNLRLNLSVAFAYHGF